MSKVIINGGGAGGISPDDLDTLPGDVLAGKKFGGVGSDEVQIGTMPDRGSPAHTLPINGVLNLPAGRYTGGHVTQSIPTMGAQTINPSASQQSIASSGKYMTGNVIVNPVSLPNAQDLRQGVNWYGRVGTLKDYSSRQIATLTITSSATANVGKSVTISNSRYTFTETFGSSLSIIVPIFLYDTYRVTCNGTTRNVVIAASYNSYNVNLDGLTIYSSGFDPYAIKSWGSIYARVAKEASQLVLKGSWAQSAPDRFVVAGTETLIDISSYTKMIVKSAGNYSAICKFCLCTKTVYSLSETINSPLTGTISEWDISNRTGSYYVGVGCGNLGDQGQYQFNEILLN